MTDRMDGAHGYVRPKRSGEGPRMEEMSRYIEQVKTRPAVEAIPKLLDLLSDESWSLREKAAVALTGFGPAAAPSVEALLRGGLWYVRAAALGVLGKLARPSSLTLVLEFIRDENRTIAEEAAKAVLMYCAQDRALAVAKLLHARGKPFRVLVLEHVGRVDPEGEARLRRLVEAGDLMGPEGSLDPSEQLRLAEEVSDAGWGIVWASVSASEPLPKPAAHLVHFLRGSETS